VTDILIHHCLLSCLIICCRVEEEHKKEAETNSALKTPAKETPFRAVAASATKSKRKSTLKTPAKETPVRAVAASATKPKSTLGRAKKGAKKVLSPVMSPLKKRVVFEDKLDIHPGGKRVLDGKTKNRLDSARAKVAMLGESTEPSDVKLVAQAVQFITHAESNFDLNVEATTAPSAAATPATPSVEATPVTPIAPPRCRSTRRTPAK